MTRPITNIYCDESTHLPADRMPYMVLGAVSCPAQKSREVSERMFEIREKHNIPHDFEIKWSKVSPAKLPFYMEIIDYFFDDDDINFRTVVAPKGKLDHKSYDQTHDDWYYKMMFYLVRNILTPEASVHIYLDKKDTRSGQKVEKLHDVLANNSYDFDRQIIRRVQIVESHHVNQLQLSDLLLGAVNYANRRLDSSAAKTKLVKRIQRRSGADLRRSTLPNERKFNVFVWSPRAAQ